MNRLLPPSVGPEARGRRALRRVAWVLAGMLLLGGTVVVVGPHLVDRFVRPRVLSALAQVSERLARPVTVREVGASWRGQVRLLGLELAGAEGATPLLAVADVRLAVSPLDALRGRTRPTHVVLDGLELNADPAGLADLRLLADRWRSRERGAPDESGAGADVRALPRIQMSNGALDLAPADGVRLRMTDLDAELGPDPDDDDGRLVLRASGRIALGDGAPVDFDGEGHAEVDGAAALKIRTQAPLEVGGLPGDLAGLVVRWTGLAVQVDRARQSAEVTVSGLDVSGARAALEAVRPDLPVRLESLSGTELHVTVARVAPRADAPWSRVRAVSVRDGAADVIVPRLGDLALGLRASSVDLERDDAEGGLRLRVRGAANLHGHPSTRLSLDAVVTDSGQVRRADVSLGGPLPVVVASRLYPRVLSWPGAHVDLDAAVERQEDGAWQVSADVSARGLTFFWTRICLVPIPDLAFNAHVEGWVNPSIDAMRWEATRVQVGDALFSAAVDLKGLGGKLVLDTRFRIPRQSCAAVAGAIPPVMIPRLEGAVFEGEMDLAIDAGIDLSRLGPKGEPQARLSVEGDLASCLAVSLGPRIRLKDLERRYVHVVREDDLDKPLRLGPGTPSYVPLGSIPNFVQQAALVTEDMGFFEHQGFKPGLIRRAMSMNVQHGWYVYGGSTITQQLVKNLYLSREKTLGRKLEEAILVWQVERTLPKERILELYLNCIEYGKHVYGIRAAAQAYFNKEVEELTPLESAFIMATKPKPRYAWSIYEKGQFNQWWVNRMQGILQRLWDKMDAIDEATFLGAAPYLPLFWYPDQGAYRRPFTDKSVVVPQGMPADLPPRDDAPAPAPAGEGRPAPRQAEPGDARAPGPGPDAAPAPVADPVPGSAPDSRPVPAPTPEAP